MRISVATNVIPNSDAHRPNCQRLCGGTAGPLARISDCADGAVVVTLRLRVAIAVSNTKTEDGVTEHVAWLGAPEQLSDTAPRNPLSDETCRVPFAVPPGCTESEVGDAAIAKSGPGPEGGICNSTET